MRGFPGTAWVGTEAGWLWAVWGAWLPAGPPLPVCGSNPRASGLWASVGMDREVGPPSGPFTPPRACVCGVWLRGVGCVWGVCERRAWE